MGNSGVWQTIKSITTDSSVSNTFLLPPLFIVPYLLRSDLSCDLHALHNVMEQGPAKCEVPQDAVAKSRQQKHPCGYH
ncbi:MAG: hypothetical protein V1715_12335 [bacterium]